MLTVCVSSKYASIRDRGRLPHVALDPRRAQSALRSLRRRHPHRLRHRPHATAGRKLWARLRRVRRNFHCALHSLGLAHRQCAA